MQDKGRKMNWQTRVLAAVVVALSAGLLLGRLGELRLRDRDRSQHVIFRNEKMAQAERALPGIQLVGSVTMTRQFGIFHRKTVDAAVFPSTVLYEDGTYYVVGGEPRDFLCTLLDTEKHPRLARPPGTRQPLKAATDKEAIREVEEMLRAGEFKGSEAGNRQEIGVSGDEDRAGVTERVLPSGRKQVVEKLVIGAWQGVCRDGDVAANIERARKVIDEAAQAGCDFVCLPELFLSGAGPRKLMVDSAMTLDDPRLAALAAHAGQRGVVTLVGLCEKRGDKYAVTQAILNEGRVAGHYTKTMPTEQDWDLMGFHDDELPVFEARGVTFGVIICHDSSFPEVAATLAWKGARIIFSPHYNNLPRQRMNDHRILVRNNHVGIAAHYGVVLVRSNVVGYWPEGDRFGYGDSAIFGPNGAPIVEAGLFTETLITADVAPYLVRSPWRQRTELRPAVIRQLSAAALKALEAK